jgi:putative hydroxymethylpyrimidine transport system substrate-binding protein
LTKPAAIAVAVVIALVLSACGAKSEDVNPTTQPFSVALDWYPNPDHAGLYVAQDKGYFKDAGLDVSLDTPSDPALPIKLVAAGKVDLALSYEPEVLLAREQGLDVQAVAAVVNRPLTSMIWLKKSKIKRVADLKGKTVSNAGIAYQEAYLKTILARADLTLNDVKSVGVSQGLVPSIVSGQAQATIGPFWNIEGIDLKMSGQDPVVTPVDKLGVPTYDELVLVARGQTIKEDPDAIRLFIGALSRGTSEAAKKPNEAIASISSANEALKPKVTAAQVKATLPLLNNKTKSRPYGFMDSSDWQAFIDWMVKNDLLANPARSVDSLTNDLLPTGVVDEG